MKARTVSQLARNLFIAFALASALVHSEPLGFGQSVMKTRVAVRPKPTVTQSVAVPNSAPPSPTAKAVEEAAAAEEEAIPAGQEAQWIWSPAHEKDKVPAGDCYFRKTLNLSAAKLEEARIEITADDTYELYVNGRSVGSGTSWRQLDKFDLLAYLEPGRNTIAVHATNSEKDKSAGLVARILLREAGGTLVVHRTDTSWKTSVKEFLRWTQNNVTDGDWIAAQSFGALGETLPWGNEIHAGESSERFQTRPGFAVERVISPEITGSLIAMAFNEFGQIVAARENGPLLLITDRDSDGTHDSVNIYCDEIKNCQGILPLNGEVLAIADGPDGAALYRLEDKNRDAKIDQVTTVLKFTGPMREHGPHALSLGPDGLIYIVVGNYSAVDKVAAETSPYSNTYEGDLNVPRYEDPGGHAVGIPAPGGTIIRTDAAGSFVETVAGGLRNPYDLAFNLEGELFTYESDMEADIGLSWYRPTRVNHIISGGEYGWRSGWANWPDYFLDGLPAAHEMGGGSPTGVTFYHHFRYPLRYHNAMFACDWAKGNINVVRMVASGSGYEMESEVFVSGQPLNVTDIVVGPDGWLYFCTGGRETEGGIYAVKWDGVIPPQVSDLGKGIERAVRQPQLQSAWARQQVARLRQQLGEKWDEDLNQLAVDEERMPLERLRALDLMQLYGPFPTPTLLTKLSDDESPLVRAKAAYLLGIYSDDEGVRLIEMLDDRDAAVRRQACEALTRADIDPPVDAVLKLLAEQDRLLTFAARRSLERIPVEQWQNEVLTDARTRVFLHGSVALLVAAPTKENAQAVIERGLDMLRGNVNDPNFPKGFISDRDFTELLRLFQLALIRGEIGPDDAQVMARELAAEYPTKDAIMNRELVRLLVYLQAEQITGSMIEQLGSTIDEVEKLHIAAHAPYLKTGWTTEQKLAMLSFYEKARDIKGGSSFTRYMENMSRDFFKNLTDDERVMVLDGGAEWPNSALAAIAGLPPQPSAAVIEQLIVLDKQIADNTSEANQRLQMGIIAILGRSQDETAMKHLREIYDQDPLRRPYATIGLAQAPAGDNWPLLIRALPILEGPAAELVLNKLMEVEQAPEDAESYRQVLLCGLRLKEKGGAAASQLLGFWSGADVIAEDDNWEQALAKWQTWFRETHPNAGDPVLPVDSQRSKWTFSELTSYLESTEGKSGDAAKGALVFQQGQCSKCHRHGDRGESVGPDLTNIGKRFHGKEILQSIVYPSHVISDQYASKAILTTSGRALVGIVGDGGADRIIVLTTAGEKIELAKSDVEQILPSKSSAMPEGLLDPLSLQQIADLFAFLKNQPRDSVTSRRSPAVK